jgi:hypothetical protein
MKMLERGPLFYNVQHNRVMCKSLSLFFGAGNGVAGLDGSEFVFLVNLE